MLHWDNENLVLNGFEPNNKHTPDHQTIERSENNDSDNL